MLLASNEDFHFTNIENYKNNDNATFLIKLLSLGIEHENRNLVPNLQQFKKINSNQYIYNLKKATLICTYFMEDPSLSPFTKYPKTFDNP